MKTKFIFILILFFCIKMWACTLIYNPPYRFDPAEYIFIGKVISHIASNQIGTSSKYHGFLVEIVDAVYLPEKPKKYFEIYPLWLGSDCKEGPAGKKYIEEFFPVGSEVRIAAKKTKIKFAKVGMKYQLEDGTEMNLF